MNLPKNEFRISITSYCNMKCVYCHNEGNIKKSMLTIDNIKRIIDSSYNLGMKNVRITGGEPLTHPDIEKIVKMLANDYHLKVGINTNCIEIDILMNLINQRLIDRVIVGLDYYDGKISKQSPIGVSSKTILENIKKIKNAGVNVSISNVYNGDYDNIYKLVNWCNKEKIRIKIIEEIKNKIHKKSSLSYSKMRTKILKDFNLKPSKDEYEEINGYVNGFRLVSFFPSLCRLRRCDLCKKIHLRITSEGLLKTCLHYNDHDDDLLNDDIRGKIIETLNRDVDYHLS